MSSGVIRRVLGTLLLALLLASPTLVASGAERMPRLLILPIVVHSSEPPEYLREGLADMLSARFERLGVLALVRESDPERATTDADTARRAARKAGADYVLFGSFTRFGRGASLDVQCAPAADTGGREPMREIFVHSGSVGDIMPDLDELAGKVSRFALGEEVARTRPDLGLAAGGAVAAGGDAASAGGDLADLLGRVEALEAALSQLLEGSGDELGGKLR